MKTPLFFCFCAVGVLGCAATSPQGSSKRPASVFPLSLQKVHQGTAQVSTGQYQRLLKLVDGVPVEVLDIINIPLADRVAGQKAILVSSGMEFESAVRELVDSGRWNIPVTVSPGFENEDIGEGHAVSDLSKVKVAAKLLYAYAEVVEEGGNPELAAHALLTCRTLGMRLMEGSGALMVNLVGIAVDAISEKGIRNAALRGSWSNDDVQLIQGRGSARYLAATSLGQSLRSEMSNYVTPLIEQTQFPIRELNKVSWLAGADEEMLAFMEQNPKPFDREATAEVARRFIELSIQELEIDPRVDKYSMEFWNASIGDVPEEGADEQELLKWCKSTPNAFGRYLLTVTMPVFGQARKAAVRNEAIRGLTEVVLAARRALTETGELPATYQDLKKFGLPDNVMDPYTHKDYRYDAVRGIAWSAGPDGKDDGGYEKPESHRDSSQDWVVQLK